MRLESDVCGPVVRLVSEVMIRDTVQLKHKSAFSRLIDDCEVEYLDSRMNFSCFQYLHCDSESLASTVESIQATNRIFVSMQHTNACMYQQYPSHTPCHVADQN